MDDQRVGRIARVLRQRKEWRQSDLAREAGCSQNLVSLIERGHLDRLSIRVVRRVLAALDASVLVDVRWRGAAMDRLLDDAHASLVAAVARCSRGTAGSSSWRSRTPSLASVDHSTFWHSTPVTASSSRSRSRLILPPPRRLSGNSTRRCVSRRQSPASGSAGAPKRSHDCSCCPNRPLCAGGSHATHRCSTRRSRRTTWRSATGCRGRTGRCRGSGSSQIEMQGVVSRARGAASGSDARNRCLPTLTSLLEEGTAARPRIRTWPSLNEEEPAACRRRRTMR